MKNVPNNLCNWDEIDKFQKGQKLLNLTKNKQIIQTGL